MEIDYDKFRKNSKDPIPLRKELILSAQQLGIKATARKFNTTVKTVRKWLRRWEEDKANGLQDRSKRPKKSPNKLMPYWYFKIQDICQTAQNDNKRINAVMIKNKYKIPYSAKTVAKYMREFGCMPLKRSTREIKRDMRAIKKKYRAFEKIQIDIKYLNDIPEFYFVYKYFKLPKYQITARCIRTGALFFAYTYEKSTTSTAIFILKLYEHLRKFEVDLTKCHIQTDNGTEFTSVWNSLKTTLFTKIIKNYFNSKHKTIPPGAKTYQSDVESSHRLIEDEFYALEYFYGFKDFLDKAYKYQKYFNFERMNNYKGGSPIQLLNEADETIDIKVLDFKPLIVDNYLKENLKFFKVIAS